MIAIAVVAAVGVAGLGGVRSFEAVSHRFGSALVPLTADGMIIACTALRLAALTRGWRLPGSLITTYGFIGGTVWLNIATTHGWADAVAHALAPISYAVLVEMLAHLLRLHLRLAQSSRPRVTALTWITSPVVTTRVWLHMTRTGEPDPAAARALVQQLIRMASRLHTVCPDTTWFSRLSGPIGLFSRARAARSAALQTIRDGVLTAAELAALLPADGRRLDPAALLALVDQAALSCTSAPAGAPTSAGTGATAGAVIGAVTAANSAAHSAVAGAVNGADLSALSSVRSDASGPSVRPLEASASPRGDLGDAELVAELRRYADQHHGGQSLTQRHVMRVFGVGTPKAKRLVELAWPTASTAARQEAGSSR